MAWPANWNDGETISAARLNSWMTAIQAWGGNVDTGGFSIVLTNSAPVDGNIPAKGVVIWIDQAANQLKFRIRYSDGTTLKSGAINIT